MAQKITIIRGDSRNIDVTFTGGDGEPLDLTGGTVFFTVNADNAPVNDNDAAITKDITSHTAPTAGESRIVLNAVDTDIAPGNYFYDVQFKDASGNITSQEQGKFLVNADITRRTS